MKKVLLVSCIFSFTLVSAQQPVISKLDKKTVVGMLLGTKNYNDASYIKIQKNKRYFRTVYTPRMVDRKVEELSKGKWKIKNDTLYLTEKFYKQKHYDDNRWVFFLFGKKLRRTNLTKLILYKGQWMEIEDNKYIAKGVYDQYVYKKRELKRKNAEGTDQ